MVTVPPLATFVVVPDSVTGESASVLSMMLSVATAPMVMPPLYVTLVCVVMVEVAVAAGLFPAVSVSVAAAVAVTVTEFTLPGKLPSPLAVQLPLTSTVAVFVYVVPPPVTTTVIVDPCTRSLVPEIVLAEEFRSYTEAGWMRIPGKVLSCR